MEKNPSVIEHHKGGTMISGDDAISMVRARTVCMGLQCLIRSNGVMRLTRTATPKNLLMIATEFTRKTYKGKNKLQEAHDDVKLWADTMASGIPHVTKE